MIVGVTATKLGPSPHPKSASCSSVCFFNKVGFAKLRGGGFGRCLCVHSQEADKRGKLPRLLRVAGAGHKSAVL